MKILHVALFVLVCSLVCSRLAGEEFTVFAPGQDAAAVMALAETLSAGTPGAVNVVETVEEALKSGAEILVLWMDRLKTSLFSTGTLAELKKKKIIGIGYGAAQVFGSLGLEVRDGACAHNSRLLKPQILWQANALLPETPDTPMVAFELPGAADKSEMEQSDYNFAMYLPSKAKRTKFVEALARWHGDENYAPIVRQGNYLLVGLAAPATLWTSEHQAVFRVMADRFAKTPRTAFATAAWEKTPPGVYEFELAHSRTSTALSSDEFFFRFDKPVRFSAALEHPGTKDVTMDFVGPARLLRTQKIARSGEVLRIQADISPEHLKQGGDRYWRLEVKNFDSTNPARCKLTIEYPTSP